MKVVVFGASGYVGGRLIPELLERGHEVRAVSRNPDALKDNPWRSRVELREADLLEPATIPPVLEGADVAYYLVHSMGREDFESLDRAAATNMKSALDDSSMQRVVYLGGLGDGELSPHLRSRQEVGEILAASAIPVTELRAAVIIGAGSLSFEMTRYLTEVLPVMVAPRWVETKCQPIAIQDVLHYLATCIEVPEAAGRVIGIGGGDVLTYAQMMRRYAGVAGLKRRTIIRVPLLSLGLSARWVGLVTPLPASVASQLIDSLRHEVIVTSDESDRLMPHDPIGYDEAVDRALDQIRGNDVPTRWTQWSWTPADPLPSDPAHAFGTIFQDTRSFDTDASPDDVAWAFMRVGGSTGYYSADWAWKVRGLTDQLFGGAGLRRGRRDPEHIRVGEPLDFWRVVRVEEGRALELKAEMLVPGQAWLGWRVDQHGDRTALTQTAWFAPRGLFGRMYWYALVPFHGMIFPQMARGIIDAAERKAKSHTTSTHDD